MRIIRTKHELRKAIYDFRRESKGTLAFIPTMGALHEGHLNLIDSARKQADFVVVSIFVNPAQFGEGEDYEEYPRTEKEDIAKLESRNVDIAYIPYETEMYESGYCISIKVEKNADILCGRYRKGHFDGVATVVTKLFMQVMPDIAIFGEKDYQQLRIINQLVKDIDVPVKVLGIPTIREEDGLAMSSRNSYLSDKEREIAPELYQTLNELKEKIEAGDSIKDSVRAAKDRLLESGFSKIDYIEVRDAETLESIDCFSGDTKIGRILAAAHLGGTRLIDNIAVVV